MVMRASEIEHRPATEDEEQIVLDMPDSELEQFLANATVVRDGTDLYAVVGGIAYHLEDIATKRKL